MKALPSIQAPPPSATREPVPVRDLLQDLLVDLVRRAVREELSEARPQVEPQAALVDRIGLSKALGVSLASVDRLRTEGLPTCWIGEAPRFEVASVISWLRSRGAKP